MSSILKHFKKSAETKSDSKPAPKPVTPAVVSVTPKPAESKQPLKGGTNEAYRVLVRPVITEKAAEVGAQGKYVFMVNRTMNKVEIKKAIRSVYGVEPVSVRVATVRGKFVRTGRVVGKKKDWKKATVTLKAGDRIEIYEGV